MTHALDRVLRYLWETPSFADCPTEIFQVDLRDSKKPGVISILDKDLDRKKALHRRSERGLELWTILRAHVRSAFRFRMTMTSDLSAPKWLFRIMYFQCMSSVGIRKLADITVL